MKKYVVWGLGNHAKFLFDNFYGLEKFVEVFLDNNYDGKNIGGGKYRFFIHQSGKAIMNIKW